MKVLLQLLNYYKYMDLDIEFLKIIVSGIDNMESANLALIKLGIKNPDIGQCETILRIVNNGNYLSAFKIAEMKSYCALESTIN